MNTSLAGLTSCALLALLFSLPASSQAPPADGGVAELSLDDLLNVEITTASRKSEKLSDAPAVMTVISREEIQALGGLSLVEILDRTTSAYFMGTQENLQGILTLRGDATQVANNHVLVLLNGRPIQESTLGGFTDSFFRSFPVESIRQIEVIRGPGSVLYGTNAYVGVVNVITRQFEPFGVARAGFGSFDTAYAVAAGGTKVGNSSISGGLSYLDSPGWRFAAVDSEGIADSMQFYDHKLGANLTVRHGNWSFNSYYARTRAPNFTNATASVTWTETGGLRAEQWMADLGYEREISSRWSTALHFTENQLDYDGDYGDGGVVRIGSTTHFLEWTNQISIGTDLTALAGASVLQRTGSFLNLTDDFLEVPGYDTYDYTAFAQLDYRLLDRVKLVAGSQVIKIPSLDPHAIGRLGALWTVSPRLNAKLLFSQAFRRPSAMETDRVRFEDGVQLREGNPDLKPEEIDTIDLQLLYLDKAVNGALTLFYSQQRDLIREPEDDEDLIQNLQALKTRGIELEIEKPVTARLAVSGALTYQESRDASDNRSIMPVPNTIGKLGVTYKTPSGWSLGLHDSYFSAARPIRELNSDVLEVNPDAEAFHNLTLNVSYKMSEALAFNLSGSNLLDSDIYYPEYTGQSVNAIPGRPGRAVFFGVSISP